MRAGGRPRYRDVLAVRVRTAQAARVRQLAAALGVLAVVLAAAWAVHLANLLATREQEVRQVCHQYASLDLSGMAHLCTEVGAQERVYVEPPWPYLDGIQPEDLDRRTTYPTDDGG